MSKNTKKERKPATMMRRFTEIFAVGEFMNSVGKFFGNDKVQEYAGTVLKGKLDGKGRGDELVVFSSLPKLENIVPNVDDEYLKNLFYEVYRELVTIPPGLTGEALKEARENMHFAGQFSVSCGLADPEKAHFRFPNAEWMIRSTFIGIKAGQIDRERREIVKRNILTAGHNAQNRSVIDSLKYAAIDGSKSTKSWGKKKIRRVKIWGWTAVLAIIIAVIAIFLMTWFFLGTQTDKITNAFG